MALLAITTTLMSFKAQESFHIFQLRLQSQCCFEVCYALVPKPTGAVGTPLMQYSDQIACYTYQGNNVVENIAFQLGLHGQTLADYFIDVTITAVPCPGQDPATFTPRSLHYFGDADQPGYLEGQRLCGDSVTDLIEFTYDPFALSLIGDAIFIGE